MRRIILIGGGHSLAGRDVSDLRKKGTVVGVNDAALLCKCDYGLSMDRLWTENRYEAVLREPKLHLWVRDHAMKNIGLVPARMHKFKCDNESSMMSFDMQQLNGSNSGMVALNFAIQMDPDEIYLLGFDMQKGPSGEPYWYPPYPWAVPQGGTSPGKYKVWMHEFDHVQQQARERAIRIVNVNHRSTIRSFPTMTWEEFSAVS